MKTTGYEFEKEQAGYMAKFTGRDGKGKMI